MWNKTNMFCPLQTLVYSWQTHSSNVDCLRHLSHEQVNTQYHRVWVRQQRTSGWWYAVFVLGVWIGAQLQQKRGHASLIASGNNMQRRRPYIYTHIHTYIHCQHCDAVYATVSRTSWSSERWVRAVLDQQLDCFKIVFRRRHQQWSESCSFVA